MKLAAVADVHLGNHKRFGGDVVGSINTRGRLALDTFRAAVDRARVLRATHFIVAGDLLDYSRPESPLLAAVQGIMRREGADFEEVFLMLGNHEQVSTLPGDHALAPLAVEDHVTIVDRPMLRLLDDLGTELILVPFQPGHAREWLARVVRDTLAGSEDAGARPPRASRGVRVLVLHLGIKDARTPPWLAGASDAIDIDLLAPICEEHGIDYVLAGNWHDRREWRLRGGKTQVLQIGALVPTGWDNPGLDGYGGLGIYERIVGLTCETIPGPRFVKADSADTFARMTLAAEKAGHKLFVSFDAQPEDMAKLTGAVLAATERGDIVGGEVIPNQEEAIVKAKSAAFAAKSSKTLHEALANYVRVMPLPDTVDRAAVHERAKGYLR